MIDLIKRMLVIGGWFLVMGLNRLVLLALYPAFVGLTLGISAEQELWQIVEGKESKRNSSESESDKQK
jgi:hypothetical protein